MKVLIAEDDPVSRHVLEATLNRWGYEVEALAEGLSALERLIAADPPLIVILDWMMPGLDGVDIVRRLRAANTQVQPYIILLTTKSGTDDVVAGLSAGADDYVRKPFDRDEIVLTPAASNVVRHRR